MKKPIFLSLFPLAFIIFVSISIGFALQNDQFHKPVNTAADTVDSNGEESKLEEKEQLKQLEEELEQLKNKYQNREKEVDPGIVIGHPEVLNDKVDPGIFLGDPEAPIIEIDPNIVK